MKFVYMDESGKEFLNHYLQKRFLFGALIIDRANVPEALAAFKNPFEKLKDIIKQGIREDSNKKGLRGNDLSNRSSKILNKFEIHSNEVFGSSRTKKSGAGVIDSPWNFIDEDEALPLLSELLLTMAPFIESIYMFEINATSYKEFFRKEKHKPLLAQNELIKYIAEDFHNLSLEQSTYITIVTDTIEAKSRDLFIKEIFSKGYDNLWVEPILVESYKNAFIQFIDLITYLYYLDYSGQLNRENPSKPFKRFKKHYKELYVNKIITKDLVTYLQNKTSVLDSPSGTNDDGSLVTVGASGTNDDGSLVTVGAGGTNDDGSLVTVGAGGTNDDGSLVTVGAGGTNDDGSLVTVGANKNP